METLAELFARATELIDTLTALVTDSPLTYLLIFSLAALDVLFPVLPSEATVTAAAVLAGTGQLTLAWVVLAAGLGAFVGDNIAYWVGRLAGRPLVTRILRGDTEQIDRVEEQFRERGGLFIIVGRFVPGGRTAVAIGAGVLHFRWARFVAYDALAAAIWAVQVSLPGYVGGVVVQDRPWLALVFGFALSMAVAASIALIQHRWGRRHSRRGDRTSGHVDGAEAVADGETAEAVESQVISGQGSDDGDRQAAREAAAHEQAAEEDAAHQPGAEEDDAHDQAAEDGVPKGQAAEVAAGPAAREADGPRPPEDADRSAHPVEAGSADEDDEAAAPRSAPAAGDA